MKVFFGVAALITSSTLFSQEDSTTQLDPVLLTATKYATKTTSTGKVVTIITKEEIQRAGSRDLAQVLTEMGGVFINGYTHNPGKEKNVYLRGAKVDHTLITIDGIPLYDASGIGSNFDIRYLPIDNIERIEILKGSQSTLYGSDAIAGVVNIITRKGGDKKIAPFVTAHYGSFQSKRVHAGLNGRQQKLDYQASFTHVSTAGFSEAARPEAVSSQYDNDAYRQHNAQVSLGWQVTPKLRIQPFFRWSSGRGDLDSDAFIDEKDYSYTARNIQGGIASSLQMGKAALHLRYQYNDTRRNYLDDSTGSRNGYYIYNEAAYNAGEHFAEAFTVIPYRSFRFTVGADYRHAATGFQSKAVDPWMPGVTYDTLSSDSARHAQYSVYAAAHYGQKAFNLEAGARLNHHGLYGSHAAFNINESYLLHQKVKLFANISSGYKVPSLYQLYSEYGNRVLKPETSLSFEGGLQVMPGSNSSIRVTYFNRRAKDVIAFFYDAATFRSMYINQDRQFDHGFEAEGSTLLWNTVQVRAQYGYVDGAIHTNNGIKDTSYYNLYRRPKHLLNASTGWQATKALFVQLQVNHVGVRQDIYYDASFNRIDMELPAYTLVNVYAEYKLWNNRLRLFADMRNITDKRYFDIYGYSTAGFNAYGGFRLQL